MSGLGLLSELFLEVFELLLDRLVSRVAFGFAPQLLEIAFRFVRKAADWRSCASSATDRLKLGGQAFVLAFQVGELVANHGELALEQAHPLAMLGRELSGDPSGFGIADLRCQPATALGVFEMLPFNAQLPLGGLQRIAVLAGGDFELHQGVM